mmetsp:Transcript_2740/g.8328  ORF Transcript_2740/g.8328 Transcript_2740/m.8328 type:complete len:277 (-) Transcript_2740:77-907(-)
MIKGRKRAETQASLVGSIVSLALITVLVAFALMERGSYEGRLEPMSESALASLRQEVESEMAASNPRLDEDTRQVSLMDVSSTRTVDKVPNLQLKDDDPDADADDVEVAEDVDIAEEVAIAEDAEDDEEVSLMNLQSVRAVAGGSFEPSPVRYPGLNDVGRKCWWKFGFRINIFAKVRRNECRSKCKALTSQIISGTCAKLCVDGPPVVLPLPRCDLCAEKKKRSVQKFCRFAANSARKKCFNSCRRATPNGRRPVKVNFAVQGRRFKIRQPTVYK